MEHLRKYIKYLPFLYTFRNYFHRKTAEFYFISFPKSGRTWLRLMIGWYFVKHFKLERKFPLQLIYPILLEPEMSYFYKEIPKIYMTHEECYQRIKPEDLNTCKSRYHNAKVLFLARNPRDVVISWYFHLKKYKQITTENLDDFIKSDYGGLLTIITYYNIWAKNRNIPKQFYLLRYEDLKENTHDELRSIMKFLGVNNVKEKIVNEAVRFGSFNNMRILEENDTLKSFRLRPVDKNNQDTYKTRRGMVNGFLDYVSSDDRRYIHQLVNNALSAMYNY